MGVRLLMSEWDRDRDRDRDRVCFSGPDDCCQGGGGARTAAVQGRRKALLFACVWLVSW